MRPNDTQVDAAATTTRHVDAQLSLRCEDTYVIGLAHDVASKVLGTNLLEGGIEAAHVADADKLTARQLVTHGRHEFGCADQDAHPLRPDVANAASKRGLMPALLSGVE